MKTCLCSLLLIIGSNATLAQFVSLQSPGGIVNYPLNTNQVITYTGGPTQPTGYTTVGSYKLIVGQPVCGLTNIGFVSGGSLEACTFSITTPQPANVVSNYIPAQAIVIPANSTGNVMVTIQSSPDLINWVNSDPGLYNAGQSTNRFFRICATLQ
jgi:hypothetical protein